MTEEIIIDGVNVAGCEFYINDYKYSCDLSFTNQEELCSCEQIKDCYYKQWQRLKQENEKLKEEVEARRKYSSAWNDKLQTDKYIKALEEIDRRIQLENADDCLLDIKDIIDEVLGNEKM